MKNVPDSPPCAAAMACFGCAKSGSGEQIQGRDRGWHCQLGVRLAARPRSREDVPGYRREWRQHRVGNNGAVEPASP